MDGNLIPMPITVETINKLYNLNLDCVTQVEEFLKKQSVEMDIKTSKDVALVRLDKISMGSFLRIIPRSNGNRSAELDTSVISRIPIRYNRDTRYFNDKYQGMPPWLYKNV